MWISVEWIKLQEKTQACLIIYSGEANAYVIEKRVQEYLKQHDS